MKTKLTPESQKKLISYIKAGSYVETACNAVGISKVTFYDWLKRGKKEEFYLNFLNAIKKAKAEAEIRNIAIVQKAAEKSWPAAMTWLERKYPQRWGRKDRLEVKSKKTVLTKQIIEFHREEKKLTEDERKQLVEFTMKAEKEFMESNANNGGSKNE